MTTYKRYGDLESTTTAATECASAQQQQRFSASAACPTISSRGANLQI
jgi:hypothetical protein